MSVWHDVATARDFWVDAPFDDDVLEELLEVAKQQVIAYAPTLPEPEAEVEEDIPVNYRKAQLDQARNLWNATKVDPASGGSGDDTYVIRPFPLDWMIRQTLRPRRGVPVAR